VWWWRGRDSKKDGEAERWAKKRQVRGLNGQHETVGAEGAVVAGELWQLTIDHSGSLKIVSLSCR
jgi:hypothetical protein